MIIDGKKYACASCIKGHRSSSCAHDDRAVFEIKRKGRPVSQCEKCRELRKTNSLHVKCVCKSKDKDAASISGTSTPASMPTPGPSSEVDPAEVKGPNFKALRAIHRATIQRAFMCQCLNGGSCVCDSQSKEISTTTELEKPTAGAKRKQPSGKALDTGLQAQETTTTEQEQGPGVSSCCSGRKPSASRRTSYSAKSRAATDSVLPLATSSGDTPSLTSDSMSASSLSVPDLPLQLDTSAFASHYPPFAKDSSLFGDVFPQQHLPSWSTVPSQQSLQQQQPPTPNAWSGSTAAFDDWVWGDILVPDSLLPPPPPAMLEAIAQGACRSCGPGCKCGEGQCQCGHVQALQRSLLQSTSDPLDRAFAESVLGLPLSSQFLQDQTSTAPVIGNQLWSAGHMPGLPLSNLPPPSMLQPSMATGQSSSDLFQSDSMGHQPHFQAPPFEAPPVWQQSIHQPSAPVSSSALDDLFKDFSAATAGPPIDFGAATEPKVADQTQQQQNTQTQRQNGSCCSQSKGL